MGKNKEKKCKSGVFLESAPVCVLTYENLQKDTLETTTDKDTSITDISLSLESSSVKRKKKKEKRNRLSEQQAENDCFTEQHTESHQDDREEKKKRKLIEEEVSQVEDLKDGALSTEELKRKKKKRKKTKGGNEDEETRTDEPSEEVPTKKKKKRKLIEEEVSQVEDIKDGDLSSEEPKRNKTKEEDEEIRTDEPSEEVPTTKKKKKLKESNDNVAEETEEVSLTVEQTQSNGKLKKKKKKSKDKSCDSLSTQHKQVESVSTTDEEEADQELQTEELVEIDAKLLSEIKEFIPNIESKDVVNIKKIIKYDLQRFKEFKDQGISLSQGRFTAQENERLKKNISDFMALTAIDNPTKLFFTHRFKEEHEGVKKLKGLHKFFERIAEGIPRSCYYVYARGRKMFDDQNYQGEFTKEELHTLNKLHTLHGNNWKKISELTGRSALSLQKRYTQLADKEGPWSNKEVQRLLRAARDYVVSQIPGAADSHGPVRVMKETLYKRLPWQKIAMKVKTRSWCQCREKWMGILAGKMSFGAVSTKKKSLDIQVKLIKGIYEIDVEDSAHVNWEDLTSLIGDVPPAYVQRKWHKLKVCNVPDWQRKCFADIVDFLYEKVLPVLENKLIYLEDLDETQDTGNTESYFLSDIFQDIEDEDDYDDDCGNKNKESQ